MSVMIGGVEKGSPAYKAGIKPGELLLSINGNVIVDVLDYRFYQNESRLAVTVLRKNGKEKTFQIKKGEYDELGLDFETYLMDKQRSCRNNCIFCFIDQLPPGMRETLYFKDDDSRLSFLFGNYITLTNLTEHEISRIIKMHISPVNISVHTTNPELRVKMMKNRFAGETLSIIGRLNDAGIEMNCQLVLVPGYNDGEELERSLRDLTAYEQIACVAAVPVGLTRYREGLTPIEPFNEQTAADVIDIIDRFGETCIQKYGERRVYAADEFYLTAKREIPDADYYGSFPQLENGVGMWSLFRDEAQRALEDTDPPVQARTLSCATGVAAAELIRSVAGQAEKKWENLTCRVYAITNRFFGERITVTGLVTGGDLIEQLTGQPLGEELFIPANMLRSERDMFLDDVTVEDVEQRLGIKVVVIEAGGADFVEALAGKNKEKGETENG